MVCTGVFAAVRELYVWHFKKFPMEGITSVSQKTDMSDRIPIFNLRSPNYLEAKLAFRQKPILNVFGVLYQIFPSVISEPLLASEHLL